MLYVEEPTAAVFREMAASNHSCEVEVYMRGHHLGTHHDIPSILCDVKVHQSLRA
jgi:hypothetical protein